VYLQNMFPFEWLMSGFKKYVRNHVRPEGSIAKGYAIEEVIEFVSTLLMSLLRLDSLYHTMRGD
jgi:hypothetical protein